MTIEEHFNHAFLSSDEYRDAKIEIMDLRPSQILDAVREMEGRLSGTWIGEAKDDYLQEEFRQSMRNHPKYSNYHGKFHPDARVGTSFLREIGRGLFR